VRSLWMLVAAFMFACMGVLVKLGAAHFSSTELVFYRSLFGVWMTYLIIRYYRLSVRTPHWRIHCWRGITGLVSLLMFFYCLTQLPLATAISLNYTWPLFVALFSTLILKEHIQWPLICTILLGFIGIILLLRPTLPEGDWVAGLMGMASFTENVNQIRIELKQLKTIYDKLSAVYPQLSILSMGMSSDYKIAIEEGSNMVRIGSLLFGERYYQK